MLMPICLWWVRKRLILVAPQGSVVLDACKGTPQTPCFRNLTRENGG